MSIVVRKTLVIVLLAGVLSTAAVVGGGTPVMASAAIMISTPASVAAAPISSSSIGVSWESVRGATSYAVSNGVVSSPDQNDTNYTWSGLAPSTYMCFTVAAKNSTGQSPWSEYACATTPAAFQQALFYSGAGDAGINDWESRRGAKSLGVHWRKQAITEDDSDRWLPRLWGGLSYLRTGGWRESCNSNDLPTSVTTQLPDNVTRLAGWSAGAEGPVFTLNYFMKHEMTDQAKRIHEVIIYDPPHETDLANSCEREFSPSVSETLGWWLGLSSENRLIMLTRRWNDDGLNEYYLPEGNRYPATQVQVCRDISGDHDDVYYDYADLMINESPAKTVADKCSEWQSINIAGNGFSCTNPYPTDDWRVAATCRVWGGVWVKLYASCPRLQPRTDSEWLQEGQDNLWTKPCGSGQPVGVSVVSSGGTVVHRGD